MTKGKYSSIAVISVPSASRNSPDTASNSWETTLATQLTIPSNIQAKKDTAQRAYHNTEVLLSQYRLIIWVLECIPGELSDELEVPVHDIDALAEKIDIQTSLENARIESRVNAMMKTRYLVDRIHEALAVIRKKPGNGEDLYSVLYTTYLDPVERKHEEILRELRMTSRTYYRLRREAITIMSIRLWSAPSGETASWLEVLTILEEM